MIMNLWTRVNRDELPVDLAEASTRDQLARRVAAMSGLEVGCTAPWFAYRGAWTLVGDHDRLYWRNPSLFVGLDPESGDRFQDGSRVVDAEALARIATATIGRE